MSLRSTPVVRALGTIPRTLGPSRGFRAAAGRKALNENDRGRDDDDVQKEIEGHKNDLLQKQKEGKGHWKKELASSSEAAIKADRDELETTEEAIKEMQKQTEKLMNEKAE